MAWKIVVPVWGERCIGTFVHSGLPSIAASAYSAGAPEIELQIFTDDPNALMPAIAERRLRHSFHPIPYMFHSVHRTMAICQGAALTGAQSGDVCVLMNADNVMSVEMLPALCDRIEQGAKLIMCMGIRTLAPELPPIGARARDLLAWAWQNRHPWIEDCIYGSGTTVSPAYLFFVNGGSVIGRAFHLHPIAVAIDGRSLQHGTITVDDGMVQRFERSEIAIINDADELALCELSPPYPKRWGHHPAPLTIEQIVDWAGSWWKNKWPLVNATHRYFFQHPIRIMGDGDAGDVEPCAIILKELDRRK